MRSRRRAYFPPFTLSVVCLSAIAVPNIAHHLPAHTQNEYPHPGRAGPGDHLDHEPGPGVGGNI